MAGRPGGQPPIKIRCRATAGCEHVFTTTASVGNKIGPCPVCGARSTVLRSDRPRQVEPVRQEPGEPPRTSLPTGKVGNDEGPGPAALWEAEPERPRPGLWHPDSPPPGWLCQECGSPLRWTPRKTTLGCRTCGALASPPRVTEQAAKRRDDMARRASRAELADPSAALRDRVTLAAKRSRYIDAAGNWARWVEPSALRDGSPLRAWAVERAGMLAAVTSALREADSPAALTVAASMLTEVAGPIRDRLDDLRQERQPPGRGELGQEHDTEAEPDGPTLWEAQTAIAAALTAALDGIPDPARLGGPYAELAAAHRKRLTDALAFVWDAESVTELREALPELATISDAAKAAAPALDSVVIPSSPVRALPAGGGWHPGPVAGAIVSAPVRSAPVPMLRGPARPDPARRCQSGIHPIARLLGNRPPVAWLAFRGTYARFGPPAVDERSPGIDVCQSAQCRAWARTELARAGYSPERQTVTPIRGA